MGSPYNYLQSLAFNYSGREIGIDKFKPYTFGSEKGQMAVSLTANLWPSILETGCALSNSINSGGLDAGLVENYDLQTYATGGFIAQPGDINTFVSATTGFVDGYPIDRSDLKLGYSGQQTEPLNETVDSFGVQSFSGDFRSVIPETGMGIMGSPMTSGGFKGQRKDTASITFIMFTGIYSSGVYTPPGINYPSSGTEQASMTFVMFTGSYQGS